MEKQQTRKKYNKYNHPLCDNKMTFEDCELAILRQAVDENEETIGKKIVNTPEIKNILKIVEDFLMKKKLMCYGGTAINNILPSYDQFYNRDAEIPDYDFYSPDALKDAKELTDIYYKKRIHRCGSKGRCSSRNIQSVCKFYSYCGYYPNGTQFVQVIV